MNELIPRIATILYEKKADHIIALDVSDMTVITDCMIIATARNSIQVRVLAEAVEDQLSALGVQPARKEGYQEARWIVLDYGDILVHIFHAEQREFYRLDKLWDNGVNRIALPFESEETEA